MTLDQIESFVTAAEQKNMRKAADLLGVTQPTLSARIRALEGQIGHKLLERMPFGVELSEAGRRWLPHARTVLLARVQGGLALSVSSELEGQKFFGLHEYLVHSYTAPIMTALKSFWPRHAIHLSTQVSSNLVERVIAGTLDAALIYDSRPHRDVAFHRVWRQRIRLFQTTGRKDDHDGYVEIDWGAEFPAFQQRYLSGHTAASFAFGSPWAAISYLATTEGSTFLDERDVAQLGNSHQLETASYSEVFLRPVYLVHRKTEEFDALLSLLRTGPR